MNYRQNVPPMDRQETLEWWLQESHDPFHEFEPDYRTAFLEASERKDLELLLHMAAEPGTAWTKRFLFCRNREVEVPVMGRSCFRSFCYYDGFKNYGRSMEGLEVFMMYGYKLKSIDIECICNDAFFGARSDDTLKSRLKMLKFCLSTAGSKKLANVNFRLTLSVAGVELARVLLMAGLVNHNPLPLPLTVPAPGVNLRTCLWDAIRERHTGMIKLLIEFGADMPGVVFPTPNHRPQSQFEQDSLVWWRAEKTAILLELGDHGTVVVNGPEYIHQLRLEITKPLRLAISENLVVAFMRASDQTPPVGIISSTVLSFVSFCEFLDYD